MEEQYYIFVDESGHCFDDFSKLVVGDDDKQYHLWVGRWFNEGHEFTFRGMSTVKDVLTVQGFEQDKDFFIEKTSYH